MLPNDNDDGGAKSPFFQQTPSSISTGDEQQFKGASRVISIPTWQEQDQRGGVAALGTVHQLMQAEIDALRRHSIAQHATNLALERFTASGSAAPAGWKLVPLEPTPAIVAGAAVAVWPTAQPADIALARLAAPLVLMQMNLGSEVSVDTLAAALATMAPAYRAMITAAPAAPGNAK